MMTSETLKKAGILQDDLYIIYNTIADRVGSNMTYTQSMNGSIFPSVLKIVLEEELENGELDGVKFLAENNYILPKKLVSHDEETIKGFIIRNAEPIMEKLRHEAEEDYYDAVGKRY